MLVNEALRKKHVLLYSPCRTCFVNYIYQGAVKMLRRARTGADWAVATSTISPQSGSDPVLAFGYIRGGFY